jgi:hypothetical protein
MLPQLIPLFVRNPALQWEFTTKHLEVSLETKVKENLYAATYLGSGTFIITKPKRSKRKLRQLRLKSTNVGMRK